MAKTLPTKMTTGSVREGLLATRAALDCARLDRLVAIEAAREAGWAWPEIGSALGLSDTGARRLYTRWKANDGDLLPIGRGRRKAA